MGRRLSAGAVILLDGPLAAGKTTMTQGIARGLGVVETVTSPTYTIVSEYAGRLILYHIDLYRITGEEEFLQLGLEEVLDGDGVCIVEWPERAWSQLPEAAMTVRLRVNGDGSRTLCLPESLVGGRNG